MLSQFQTDIVSELLIVAIHDLMIIFNPRVVLLGHRSLQLHVHL